MDILFALILILVCALPALLILLPPFRRRARTSVRVRRSAVFLCGLLSFGLCFWTVSYLTIEVALFVYSASRPPDYFHNLNDTDPEQVARDMQEYADYQRSLRATIDPLKWWSLLPPLIEYPTAACSSEPPLCDELAQMQREIANWSSYLLRLSVAIASGLLSGGLVWLLTRQTDQA